MSSDQHEVSNVNSEANAQTFYAAERTLLAWVRTGLAMMGFGFVVSRFGLFLRELSAIKSTPVQQHTVSLVVGVTLVVMGGIVSIGAGFRHWHTVRRLHRGQPIRFHSISFGTLIATAIGVLGFVTAIYLVFGVGGEAVSGMNGAAVKQ